MLPFERLRALARSPQDGAVLALEAAECLAWFDEDPAGLVVACRRLLAHHPAEGPLWWLCARVLAAGDPADAAWEARELLRADGTLDVLARGLRDARDRRVDVVEDHEVAAVARGALAGIEVGRLGPGAELGDDLPARVVIVTTALSPSEALVSPTAARVARSGTTHAVPIWLTATVGRLLAPRVFDALLQHLPAAPPADLVRVPVSEFAAVVLDDGIVAPEDLGRYVDCPVAPELLRRV